MQHYYLHFAKVYAAALLTLMLILIFVFPLGYISLLPTLVIAAFISTHHFFKREQRLASSEEKMLLIWGLSAVAIVMGSVFTFFLVLMNPKAEQILKSADQAGLALSAVIMLCMVAVHATVFFTVYAISTKLFLKKIV